MTRSTNGQDSVRNPINVSKSAMVVVVVSAVMVFIQMPSVELLVTALTTCWWGWGVHSFHTHHIPPQTTPVPWLVSFWLPIPLQEVFLYLTMHTLASHLTPHALVSSVYLYHNLSIFNWLLSTNSFNIIWHYIYRNRLRQSQQNYNILQNFSFVKVGSTFFK